MTTPRDLSPGIFLTATEDSVSIQPCESCLQTGLIARKLELSQAEAAQVISSLGEQLRKAQEGLQSAQEALSLSQAAIDLPDLKLRDFLPVSKSKLLVLAGAYDSAEWTSAYLACNTSLLERKNLAEFFRVAWRCLSEKIQFEEITTQREAILAEGNRRPLVWNRAAEGEQLKKSAEQILSTLGI